MHQQSTFTHHSQYAFAIHRKVFLSSQPPGHAAISVRGFLSAGHHDVFVVLPIRSTLPRLFAVIQTRSADRQRRRHQRGCVALRHDLSCLGVNFTAAHSPTTFFRISISSDFRPSVRSNCRMRWSFSVSPAAALFPPSAAFAPASASSFHRYNSDGEIPCRRHVSETFPLLIPSCTICHFSSGVRSTRGLLPMMPPVLEALILPR